jgi:hypothetical protein
MWACHTCQQLKSPLPQMGPNTHRGTGQKKVFPFLSNVFRYTQGLLHGHRNPCVLHPVSLSLGPSVPSLSHKGPSSSWICSPIVLGVLMNLPSGQAPEANESYLCLRVLAPSSHPDQLPGCLCQRSLLPAPCDPRCPPCQDTGADEKLATHLTCL